MMEYEKKHIEKRVVKRIVEKAKKQQYKKQENQKKIIPIRKYFKQLQKLTIDYWVVALNYYPKSATFTEEQLIKVADNKNPTK